MDQKDAMLIIDFVSVAKKEMSNKSYLEIKHILRKELGLIIDNDLGNVQGDVVNLIIQ